MEKKKFQPMAAAVLTAAVILQPFSTSAGHSVRSAHIAKSIISGEPKDSRGIGVRWRFLPSIEREWASGYIISNSLTEEEQRVISGAAERNPCRGRKWSLYLTYLR